MNDKIAELFDEEEIYVASLIEAAERLEVYDESSALRKLTVLSNAKGARMYMKRIRERIEDVFRTYDKPADI